MKGRDLINGLLPDELIAEVFRRLGGSKPSCDACALVCRRWLGIERACRRHVRIGANGDADRLMEALVRRFSGLQSICVDERLPISCPSPLVARIPPRKRHAKRSSEARATMENNEFGENAVACSISDAGLAALANGCKGLEKLSLIWCSSITSTGLSSIAESCKSLRSLDLQGCYVGDQGLIAIGESCQLLEDLNLRFCEGLTDKGLAGLAKGCANSLRVLGIATCAWITDNSLKAVAAHCSSLESLSLDSEFIKNEGIIAIAEGCRSLRALKLLCRNVTDEGLQAVGSFCSSLELLALYSFQKFTDRSLYAIGKKCKNLRSLTLSDCYFLSDKSLETVAAGCTGLTYLEINGCHNIGTLGLESIGRSCPKLSELALLYCQRIRNSALLEIGRGCTLLQALHLVDCLSIDDEALCEVAQGCRNLKKLHVRRCYEDCNIIPKMLDCQRFLIHNNPPPGHHSVFSTAWWNADSGKGGIAFFITDSNLNVILAGCKDFHNYSRADSGMEAVYFAISMAEHARISIRNIYTSCRETLNLLANIDCRSSDLPQHIYAAVHQINALIILIPWIWNKTAAFAAGFASNSNVTSLYHRGLDKPRWLMEAISTSCFNL